MEQFANKGIPKGMKSDPLKGQNAVHANKMLKAMKQTRIPLHTKSIK